MPRSSVCSLPLDIVWRFSLVLPSRHKQHFGPKLNGLSHYADIL